MWEYKGIIIDSIDKVPEGAVGYVYRMVCTSNSEHLSKFYIGKKSLYSERKTYLTKKEIALLPNKRLKKWKTVVKESNWLEYESSSEEIKKLIAEGLEFKKEILHFAFSKWQLTYLEVKTQFEMNVLEREDCFNGNILNKFFKGRI